MNTQYNLFELTELNQFKKKTSWLCNFTLTNIDKYYEHLSKNQRELGYAQKMAGIFATQKIIDLTIYILSKENQKTETNKETLDLLSSLKQYIDISVGFDNFENDILLKNINDVILNIVLPLCNNIELKNIETVMQWGGKEVKIANTAVSTPSVTEQPLVQKSPLPTYNTSIVGETLVKNALNHPEN